MDLQPLTQLIFHYPLSITFSFFIWFLPSLHLTQLVTVSLLIRPFLQTSMQHYGPSLASWWRCSSSESSYSSLRSAVPRQNLKSQTLTRGMTSECWLASSSMCLSLFVCLLSMWEHIQYVCDSSSLCIAIVLFVSTVLFIFLDLTCLCTPSFVAEVKKQEKMRLSLENPIMVMGLYTESLHPLQEKHRSPQGFCPAAKVSRKLRITINFVFCLMKQAEKILGICSEDIWFIIFPFKQILTHNDATETGKLLHD